MYLGSKYYGITDGGSGASLRSFHGKRTLARLDVGGWVPFLAPRGWVSAIAGVRYEDAER